MFVLACAKPAGPAEPVSAAAPVQAEQTEDAPRITLADAKKDYDDATAIFIDTRPADSYNQEHIKGSINITSADLKSKLKDLPKDKKIIAYCS